VSKAVSSNVKVALSGLGGDELFIGYNGYFRYLQNRRTPVLSFFDHIAEFHILKRILPFKVLNHLFSFRANNDNVLQYIFHLQKNVDLFTRRFLNSDLLDNNPYLLTAKMIRENYPLGTDRLNQIRLLYISQHMGNILLRDSDSVSMKHSLEVRFPLIDIRLTEQALKMPIEYLIADLKSCSERNYNTSGLKRMLLDAFKRELPPDSFNLSKKGFQVPMNNWLRTTFRPYMEDTINNPSDLFNKKEIKSIYQDGVYPDYDFKKLWSILVLDHWFKKIYKHKF
jgi:asparagine synthase (glutamine-hydrolysing)